MPTTLLQSDLPGLPLRHRGKVRDVFDIPRERLPADAPPGEYLLMVATDRLSAFDVVLPDPIPGKGEMLCQVSNFWFAKTAHLMPNHLTGIDVANQAAQMQPGVRIVLASGYQRSQLPPLPPGAPTSAPAPLLMRLIAPAIPCPPSDCVVVPDGVVTVIMFASFWSTLHSIR